MHSYYFGDGAIQTQSEENELVPIVVLVLQVKGIVVTFCVSISRMVSLIDHVAHSSLVGDCLGRGIDIVVQPNFCTFVVVTEPMDSLQRAIV